MFKTKYRIHPYKKGFVIHKKKWYSDWEFVYYETEGEYSLFTVYATLERAQEAIKLLMTTY
jgi:adenine/guanine phosphoribosyltransferase-like PRPP-binding protein